MKMRTVGWAVFALSIASLESAALARMAGKFERVGFLAAALDHLSEAAHMLQDPISAIEVHGNQVFFVAGSCHVTVTVEDKSALGSTASFYSGRIGEVVCN
jgi:hypothetical protein